MNAHKFAASGIAGVAVAGLFATGLVAAGLTLTAAPAMAQSATPDIRTPTVRKRPAAPPTQVAVTGRPPARVTVRRRSYLDPGTETRTHQEHYQDYAFPPGNQSFTADRNNPFINWTRMPFPDCFDLPGFCRP